MNIDNKGEREAASALLKLTDLIEGAGLDGTEKEQLRQLVEALADEARKPEPRAVAPAYTRRAVGDVSGIDRHADQAGPLMQAISQMWQ